jgi:predicted nucleic acid-binding Zn ribbon protein
MWLIDLIKKHFTKPEQVPTCKVCGNPIPIHRRKYCSDYCMGLARNMVRRERRILACKHGLIDVDKGERI